MQIITAITTTSGKQELISEIDKAVAAMLEQMAGLDNSEVNTVPYKDSWTAGMLLRHVSKSITAMSGAMAKEGTPAERNPGEKIPKLKETFLDLSTKMKSPDFIVPEDVPYEKQASIEALKNSFGELKKNSGNANLTDLVTGLPLGDITKLEILHFVLYHTLRHTEQMKKICGALKEKVS